MLGVSHEFAVSSAITAAGRQDNDPAFLAEQAGVGDCFLGLVQVDILGVAAGRGDHQVVAAIRFLFRDTAAGQGQGYACTHDRPRIAP